MAVMGRTNDGQRKKQRPRRRQQQIRMEDDLKARIHKYQEEESERVGYEVTFSAVVRKLIEKGLEA